jgi:crossover junction endodeoxyribonuclease RusA
MSTLNVFVPGSPAPQGSKRYVGRGILVESSKAVKPWRADIRAACIDVDGQPLVFFDGPVSVRLEFVMKRPISAPKRSTPAAVKKPDIDKLARAVLDAIGSAGCWHDDSQVVRLSLVKRLAEIGETPGCRIRIKTAMEMAA